MNCQVFTGCGNGQVSHQSESEDHTSEKAHKRGIYLGFETQGRRNQKFKTGVPVAPRKGLVSSKKLFLKKKGGGH